MLNHENPMLMRAVGSKAVWEVTLSTFMCVSWRPYRCLEKKSLLLRHLRPSLIELQTLFLPASPPSLWAFCAPATWKCSDPSTHSPMTCLCDSAGTVPCAGGSNPALAGHRHLTLQYPHSTRTLDALSVPQVPPRDFCVALYLSLCFHR